MKTLEKANAYWSYNDLIASMEVEVLHEWSEDDYQGDSHLIIREPNRCGYMTYGWGSCSGCDALEAAQSSIWSDDDAATLGNITEIRDQMYNQTHWEETPAKLFAYMADKDWSLDWRYHDQGFKVFLTQALIKLADLSFAEVK